MTEDYFLFTFDDTHDAIASQALLEDLGPVVMPTLRSISASCGISLRLPPDRAESARLRMEASPAVWQLWQVTGGACALRAERRPAWPSIN